MPLGRIVVGRISKTEESTNGDKRFDYSTRRTLVVYGVGNVDRKKLDVGGEVHSIVMAVAEGKAFAQIKGSYIKIKVKGYDSKDKLQAGDHIISTLKKVTKEKISSVFKSKCDTLESNEDETLAQSIYESVQEEAEKDIESLKVLNNTDAKET